MEDILDTMIGLFENKRKCGVGIATLHSTTPVSQKPRLHEVLQALTGHCNLSKH